MSPFKKFTKQTESLEMKKSHQTAARHLNLSYDWKTIHESWVKQPIARHLKHFQVYLLFANPSGPFRGLVRFGFGTHSRSPKSWKDWGAQFFPPFFLWESPNFADFGPTTVRGEVATQIFFGKSHLWGMMIQFDLRIFLSMGWWKTTN